MTNGFSIVPGAAEVGVGRGISALSAALARAVSIAGTGSVVFSEARFAVLQAVSENIIKLQKRIFPSFLITYLPSFIASL
jgi:hypothetical protein